MSYTAAKLFARCRFEEVLDPAAAAAVTELSYKPNVGKFSMFQRRQKVARVPLCYGRT